MSLLLYTEHVSNENPNVTVLSDQELEASINSLKQEILNLSPPTPSGNATYSVQPIPKPITKQPHCTTCGHIVKGYKKSKDQEKFCPQCPRQTCSPSGKQDQCDRQQYQSNQQPPSIANLVLFTTTKFPGQVKEILLPSHLSQSELSSSGGSNACTVISILTGLKFLKHELHFPQPNAASSCINAYRDLIKDGNLLYEIIDPPVFSPNLYVTDVLDCIDLPLEIPTDYIAVWDKHQLLQHFENFCGHHKCTVLIIPPDKSVTVCFCQDLVLLLDSHKHYIEGGIISSCTTERVADFINYLESMAQKSWGVTLGGSNFTELNLIT